MGSLLMLLVVVRAVSLSLSLTQSLTHSIPPFLPCSLPRPPSNLPFHSPSLPSFFLPSFFLSASSTDRPSECCLPLPPSVPRLTLSLCFSLHLHHDCHNRSQQPRLRDGTEPSCTTLTKALLLLLLLVSISDARRASEKGQREI